MSRKTVKPALEGGRIWNPDHAGFLPAGGIEVEVAPYWIALEQRGDIVMFETTPEAMSSEPLSVEVTPAPPAA